MDIGCGSSKVTDGSTLGYFRPDQGYWSTIESPPGLARQWQIATQRGPRISPYARPLRSTTFTRFLLIGAVHGNRSRAGNGLASGLLQPWLVG